MDFENISTLPEYGYCSPVSLADLIDADCQQVPDRGGVYVVVREPSTPPQFLIESPAGHFDDRNPTVAETELLRNWVDQVVILYVGETDNLRRRFKQFIRFGHGQPVGHWGGRYLWQLEDSANLCLSWKLTPDENPVDLKRRLLKTFRVRYSKLPFANLKN
ncbi:MAG: hypothetical protein ABI690_23730 [Chloroflexota bacterium]